MPHMSSGGSEDFYSTDEVKVYKDEGNKDEEERSSENLSEDKLGLVTESEEGKNSSIQGTYNGSEKGSGSRVDDDKVPGSTPVPGQPTGSMGFFIPPYAPYANGGGKFGMVQPPYPGFVMYNDFAQPPPAHMGIPPVHTDPKTGLPRPPMYAAYPPHSQFPHPLYGPDFPQVPWHRPGYPITTGAFSGSLHPSLSISRYGHPLLPPGIPHPGMPHPGMPPGHKPELMGATGMHERLDGRDERSASKSEAEEKRRNYVKKPLNAFMLFMKEMRPKVIAECTLRESSAINQILGRKWHALERSEQAKYYEMARKEKDLHNQLHPGWSARDNYAVHQKKKKRKKTEPAVMQENKAMVAECPNAKKCRARYGMDQQSQWCKPCRRKKKCIRYLREDGASSDEDYDDGSSRLGSHRSNDTDSIHDMDTDSPRPDPHLSFNQPHSPLSPLIQEEKEEEVAGGKTCKADMTFPAASSISSFLPLSMANPSHHLLPPLHLTSSPIKMERPLSLTVSSPSLKAT